MNVSGILVSTSHPMLEDEQRGAVLNPYRCGLTFLGGGGGVSSVRVFGDPSTWLNAIAVTLAFRQLKG